MYDYIYIYTHIYTFSVCVCLYTQKFTYFIYLHSHTHTYFLYVHNCVYIHMYIYIYAKQQKQFVYIYIYRTYQHTHSYDIETACPGIYASATVRLQAFVGDRCTVRPSLARSLEGFMRCTHHLNPFNNLSGTSTLNPIDRKLAGRAMETVATLPCGYNFKQRCDNMTRNRYKMYL